MEKLQALDWADQYFIVGVIAVFSLMLVIMAIMYYYSRQSRRMMDQLKETTKALEHELNYDPLTGLYNRRGFYKKMTPVVAGEPDRTFVFIYANICGLKVINEVYGVEVGDHVLIQFADYLKSSNVQGEVYARMDADRFIICVKHSDFSMSRILAASKQKFVNAEVTFTFNVRFGIYYEEENTMPLNAMCDRAKAAKRNIKDLFYAPYAVWDESMREAIVAEQMLGDELLPALADNQFKVYYQPIVAVESGEIVSAEALIRWIHPSRGIISPGIFIPMFEKSAAITKLDIFVGQTVSLFVKDRLNQGKRMVPVSINLSQMDFYREGIQDAVEDAIKSADISHTFIRLELTESAYINNQEVVVAQLRQFQEKGIKVLMDDFGSGYSNFNTLHRVPVDILKLDRYFKAGHGIFRRL